MQLKELIKKLENQIPRSEALDWDNVGLLVGDREQQIHKVYLALDLTDAVLEHAIAAGADLILTHHPLIFGGIKPLSGTSIDRYKLKACEKVNIRPITQHQFRHSYATYLISNGIPINTVSKLLGHSSVDTTAKIYIHQDLTQEKRVLDTLNSYNFSFASLCRDLKRKLSIIKHF